MEYEKVSNYKMVIPKLESNNERYPMDDVFNKRYFSMFICAKRNSGKSILIYNLLKNLKSKNTRIILISPTCHADHTYEAMKKELKDKLILLDSLEEDITDESGKTCKGSVIISLLNYINNSEEKTNDYIVVMDDSAAYLRDPSVSILLKNGRHYKIKVILSSQYFNDLPRDCRTNIEYYALFRGQSEDKLLDLYENMGINNMDFDKFYSMYTEVTNKKYQFLFIDLPNMQYREGLNNLLKFNTI